MEFTKFERACLKALAKNTTVSYRLIAIIALIAFGGGVVKSVMYGEWAKIIRHDVWFCLIALFSLQLHSAAGIIAKYQKRIMELQGEDTHGDFKAEVGNDRAGLKSVVIMLVMVVIGIVWVYFKLK